MKSTSPFIAKSLVAGAVLLAMTGQLGAVSPETVDPDRSPFVSDLADPSGTFWFASVLTNATNATFEATEVHFGAELSGDCDQSRADVRIWTLASNSVPDLLSIEFGQEILVVANSTVASGRNDVSLGEIYRVAPGSTAVVAVGLSGQTNTCRAAVLSDLSTVADDYPHSLVYGRLDCVFGTACCADPVLQWRNYNGGCADSPPGFGATGNLAIRLAHPSH